MKACVQRKRAESGLPFLVFFFGMFNSHNYRATGIDGLQKNLAFYNLNSQPPALPKTDIGPPSPSVLTPSPSGLKELNDSEPVSKLQPQVNSKVSETFNVQSLIPEFIAFMVPQSWDIWYLRRYWRVLITMITLNIWQTCQSEMRILTGSPSGPNFAIRTPKMDRLWVSFDELLFFFLDDCT